MSESIKPFNGTLSIDSTNWANKLTHSIELSDNSIMLEVESKMNEMKVDLSQVVTIFENNREGLVKAFTKMLQSYSKPNFVTEIEETCVELSVILLASSQNYDPNNLNNDKIRESVRSSTIKRLDLIKPLYDNMFNLMLQFNENEEMEIITQMMNRIAPQGAIWMADFLIDSFTESFQIQNEKTESGKSITVNEMINITLSKMTQSIPQVMMKFIDSLSEENPNGLINSSAACALL